MNFLIFTFLAFSLFFGNLFAETVYRIRMPNSSYSAKLVGLAATRTAGEEVHGLYNASKNVHEFEVELTGRYQLWLDPAGGSSYILDSDWDKTGLNGKVLIGSDTADLYENLTTGEQWESAAIADKAINKNHVLLDSLSLAMRDSGFVGLPKYPFADAAKLPDYQLLALRDVKLTDADVDDAYYLERLAYNDFGATHRLQVAVRRTSDGTEVCAFRQEPYTASDSVEVITLSESNGSGITGSVVLDWRVMPDDFLAQTGLDSSDAALDAGCWLRIEADLSGYMAKAAFSDSLSNYDGSTTIVGETIEVDESVVAMDAEVAATYLAKAALKDSIPNYDGTTTVVTSTAIEVDETVIASHEAVHDTADVVRDYVDDEIASLGVPAGSSGAVQYNNGGVLGGFGSYNFGTKTFNTDANVLLVNSNAVLRSGLDNIIRINTAYKSFYLAPSGTNFTNLNRSILIGDNTGLNSLGGIANYYDAEFLVIIGPNALQNSFNSISTFQYNTIIGESCLKDAGTSAVGSFDYSMFLGTLCANGAFTDFNGTATGNNVSGWQAASNAFNKLTGSFAFSFNNLNGPAVCDNAVSNLVGQFYLNSFNGYASGRSFNNSATTGDVIRNTFDGTYSGRSADSSAALQHMSGFGYYNLANSVGCSNSSAFGAYNSRYAKGIGNSNFGYYGQYQGYAYYGTGMGAYNLYNYSGKYPIAIGFEAGRGKSGDYKLWIGVDTDVEGHLITGDMKNDSLSVNGSLRLRDELMLNQSAATTVDADASNIIFTDPTVGTVNLADLMPVVDPDTLQRRLTWGWKKGADSAYVVAKIDTFEIEVGRGLLLSASVNVVGDYSRATSILKDDTTSYTRSDLGFGSGAAPDADEPIKIVKDVDDVLYATLDNASTGTAAGIGIQLFNDDDEYVRLTHYGSNHSSYPNQTLWEFTLPLYLNNQATFRIGNTSNYTQFSTAGAQTFVGGARYYHYGPWISPSQMFVGTTNPAAIIENGLQFVVAEFTDGVDEEVRFNMQLPENIDDTFQVDVEVMWSSPATSQSCVWDLVYNPVKLDQSTDSGWASAQITATSSSTANGLVVSTFTIHHSAIDSDDLLLQVRLRRDGNNILDSLGDVAEVHGVRLKTLNVQL